jgi:hypothetical protein
MKGGRFQNLAERFEPGSKMFNNHLLNFSLGIFENPHVKTVEQNSNWKVEYLFDKLQ